MKLLLVDPAPPAALISELETQFSLTHCLDPNAAPAIASKLRPDWIVLEALLPDCDGFDLCRSLRHLPGLEATKIALLSDTLLSSSDHAQASRVGAARLLPRQLEPARLLASLQELSSTQVPPPTAAGSPQEWDYLKETHLRFAQENQLLHARQQALRSQIQQHQENQRLLEQRLRHAQRLGAIGTLSSGVAHDFNNILCGIIGLSEIGLRIASCSPECTRSFEDIRTASQRAASLVRAMLSFSRRQEQPKGPIYPSHALAEALTMLRATIPSFIRLEEQTPETPTAILGEISQFQQIVTNLVLNAWHSIGTQPGQIRLRIQLQLPPEKHLLKLPHLQKTQHVCVEISDTGSGIPPENLDRIFDPFFTTKPAAQGTGLGLWVSRGIVESWNGGMTVESTVGKGTTFFLYFPEASASLHPHSDSAPLPKRGNGQKILFVEEEKLLASTVQHSLASFGYQPTVVTTAEEAIHQARSGTFDAAFTDLTMRGGGGLELAKSLWDLHPHLPIILTTGHTDAMDESMAQSIGFCALLPKPFDSLSLIRTLQAILP